MVSFYQTTLKNKIEVVGEKHPYGNAVALGFALRFGSRDEWSEKEHGMAHFIEHLVFKSTQKYNSFDLVNVLEEKGGDLNAFTCKEFTCMHFYGLKEDLEKAIDVISQICFFSNWTEADFDSEKEVIKQEILMSYDNPEDYMFDDFTNKYFAGSSLAHPIFGTLDSLEKIELEDVRAFMKEFYRPENTIVSIAGDFGWNRFVSLLESYTPENPAEPMKDRVFDPVHGNKFVHFETKDIQQHQLIMAFPVNAIRDGIHYPVSILSNYLGSGMNSVLFQELREKKALCYSVSASYGPNEQAGMFSVMSSTTEEKLPELLSEVRNILFDLQEKGLAESALEKVKMQIRCGLLLGESDVDARMHSMIYDKIFSREYRSIKDLVESISSLNTTDMQEYLSRFFKPNEASYYVMGRNTSALESSILSCLS
jgi:predicted Zn-dependent peptidase